MNCNRHLDKDRHVVYVDDDEDDDENQESKVVTVPPLASLKADNKGDLHRAKPSVRGKPPVTLSTSVSDGDDSEENLYGKKWEQMFSRLVAYKKANGNSWVRNRYPQDPSVGHWGRLFPVNARLISW